MECSSERKALMAIYELEGDANHWWNNTEIILEAQNILVTWEVFKERFNEKYFPRSIRDDREAEFLKVSQGIGEPFEDYLTRFYRLSRYYSHQEQNDGRWMTNRLVRGLNTYMRERITPMQLEDFDLAIEKCRLTESCMPKSLFRGPMFGRPDNVSNFSV